ncbi:MAG: hypothetical protein LBT04_01105 [Prevotellaceae bacterium]|jgi:hypothetical protein|nr:hypothetical protein [Prevotellaceae bacterium]
MNPLRQLNHSLSAAIVFNFLLSLFWWLPWILGFHAPEAVTVTAFYTLKLFDLSGLWVVLLEFVVCALLIFWTNHRFFFRDINTITYLQFSLMGLMCTTWFESQTFGNHTIAVIFFVFAVSQLLKINDSSKNISKSILNTFVALSISSAFVYQYFYTIPVFIFGFLYFAAINRLRILFISLVSIVVPAIVFLGFCYITDSITVFTDYFFKIFSFVTGPFDIIFQEKLELFVLIFYTAVSMILFLRNSPRIKYKTKKIIYFFVLLWFVLTILTILFNDTEIFVLACIIYTSYLLTLNFVEFKNKLNRILFDSLLVLFLAMYVIRVFINL